MKNPLSAWFLPLLLVLTCVAARARDPVLDVIRVSGRVPEIQVEVALRHAFNDEILSDIRSGNATIFHYQFRLRRVRIAWNDPVVARLDGYKTVTYALLERRYDLQSWLDDEEPQARMRADDPGEVQTYMSRMIGTLRLEGFRPSPEDLYYLSARALLKEGQLPKALKSMFFFVAWDFKTPWRDSRYFRFQPDGGIPVEP